MFRMKSMWNVEENSTLLKTKTSCHIVVMTYPTIFCLISYCLTRTMWPLSISVFGLFWVRSLLCTFLSSLPIRGESSKLLITYFLALKAEVVDFFVFVNFKQNLWEYSPAFFELWKKRSRASKTSYIYRIFISWYGIFDYNGIIKSLCAQNWFINFSNQISQLAFI